MAARAISRELMMVARGHTARVLDVLLQVYAISVVAMLAGSFGRSFTAAASSATDRQPWTYPDNYRTRMSSGRGSS